MFSINKKGFVPILVLVGILIILVVAGGVFYLGKTTKKSVLPRIPVITPGISRSSPTPSITEAPKFELGKIIVKFKPGISVNFNVSLSQATDSKSINQLLAKIQANKIKSLYYEENTPMYATSSARDPILERYYIVSFSKDSNVEQIVSEFQADPGVEVATPNRYTRIQ